MVTTTTRGFVAILGAFALVSFVSLQAVSAQAPAPSAPAAQAPAPPSPAPAQAGAQKTETAKGELKSVDAKKMTFTLVNGQTFEYNSSTKVTGAQGGAAGLATLSGREVMIDYETKGADRIATTITVIPDKK